MKNMLKGGFKMSNGKGQIKLSANVNERLELISKVLGSTKTSIVNIAVTQWINDQMDGPMQDLIDEYIEQEALAFEEAEKLEEERLAHEDFMIQQQLEQKNSKKSAKKL